MSDNLRDEAKQLILQGDFKEDVVEDFMQLLESDRALTRDEGAQQHLSTFFLPYNPLTKEVFQVHHKKSNLWLSPGGHIDKGENILTTLNREAAEELGADNAFSSLPSLFYISTVEIDREKQPECKKHYDLWFLFETDGKEFKIDTREFYSAGWFSIPEAKALHTYTDNLSVLTILEHE